MNIAGRVLPPIESFNTIILAGGGNRCWWQAGVLAEWTVAARIRAQRFAGTSAGAGVLVATLAGQIDIAIDACQRLYNANPSIFANRQQPRSWFAHESIYPRWIESFMTTDALTTVKSLGVEVQIGIARLVRGMPTSLGVGLGVLAYLVDKYGFGDIHPRLPTWLGYRMELRRFDTLQTQPHATHLLVAAAAAPPFIRAREIDQRQAFDGGLVDNAPRLAPIDPCEQQLVLLTRHYPKRPRAFIHAGRWYLQPSRPVPVSTWDCTPRADISGAVALGRRDSAVDERSRA